MYIFPQNLSPLLNSSIIYYRKWKVSLEDRREKPRIELDILVNYAENAKARVKDISESGIRIRTQNFFKTNNFLLLTFSLPRKSDIKAYVKVIWCKRVESGMYESGLEFWDIKNEDREIVRSFINDSLRKGSET